MKDTLVAGLTATRRFTVDKDSTIDFMGDELRVYATPSLVRDVEITCREYLLDYVDEGEDSVGTRVEIDHMAPTLLGMWAEIAITVAEVKGPLVTFEFTGRDPVDQIARGRHTRFISNVAKTAQRLQAKAAKAAEG
ncbi:MAG: LysR family transcriptional regulator [Hyphomicrobiales bacterium]|nr:LysR family transcriptional regulator [Hyphomicrobiales bacterium]